MSKRLARDTFATHTHQGRDIEEGTLPAGTQVRRVSRHTDWMGSGKTLTSFLARTESVGPWYWHKTFDDVVTDDGTSDTEGQ